MGGGAAVVEEVFGTRRRMKEKERRREGMSTVMDRDMREWKNVTKEEPKERQEVSH